LFGWSSTYKGEIWAIALCRWSVKLSVNCLTILLTSLTGFIQD
jgi:hypothetical protein